MKRIKTFILLLLGLAAIPAFSTIFEPICQVGSVSGFCRPFASTPIVTPPKPALKEFGTFERPFNINSLWNIRPKQVAFSNDTIPTSRYFPKVGTGAYSSASFEAKPTDLPMTIYPIPGRAGVWEVDAQRHVPSITIPRWPAETFPATGTDGHADIVDPESGIIHSLFKLQRVDGRWVAQQYAWTRLDGRGFGDGVHYFQGARAAAVPPIAGMIRKHEINDGASQYYHALAMSMDYSGMSGTQQYVFPATSGDTTYRENFGQFPTGALMMLPPDYDTSGIANPDLLKVVKTLKTYGAYVVDRNVGTPFYIYVENGTDYTLHPGGWNSAVGNELQRLRQALRQVVYAKDWVNINGQPVENLEPLNVLHMRGPWTALWGGSAPRYHSHSQSAVFGPTDKRYRFETRSGRAISHVHWAKPVPGKVYEFKAFATGGARAQLRYWGTGVGELIDSGMLVDGQTYRVTWPVVPGFATLSVESGVGSGSTVIATLKPVD